MSFTIIHNLKLSLNDPSEFSEDGEATTANKPMAPKYGKKFVTLKWVKKGETKDFIFYNDIMNHFRKYGEIKSMVYGPDSLDRPHMHFIYEQTKWFKYNSFRPKFLRIHIVPYHYNHMQYMKNHKIVP